MGKHILVVGSGAAGLSCAVAAAEAGNRVTIVSPLPSERSQSVMAAGGINAVLTPNEEGDSIESHIRDTIRGGCFLAERDEVGSLCADAPDIIRWLDSFGTVFTRDAAGRPARRAFGGQSHRRTVFAGANTGKQIVTALTNELRRYECSGQVTRLTGMHFHSGLIDDGECCGALFYDDRNRGLAAIYADAVVMATGGQNQLFGKTTGTLLCDGYAQGRLFAQGAQLKNLEFIQYHPTTIETPMKRMLVTEAARGEGGRLFYLDGKRRIYFMEDKYGENGNLMPRDIVSKCIYDAPSQVYLDISFLGKALIRDRLAEVAELCRDYAGIDVTRTPIPVYPSVHFFMGGLSVNRFHQTNIRRLYAVGECASLYHGANRLGGNSLLAAIHGGRIAAKTITEAPACARTACFDAYIRDAGRTLDRMLATQSKFPAVYIRQELAKIMNEDLGITRCEAKLKQGLDSVAYYLSVSDKLSFDASVSPYEAYSLPGMLLLAQAVLCSALERKETRGAHIREDHPETLEAYRAVSLADRRGGSVLVTFRKAGDNA